MKISFRERFLGICRFERPGDLWYRDWFWPETLRKWVEQGAPKQMDDYEYWRQGDFIGDYFQFDKAPYKLEEIRSGAAWSRGKVYDFGYGIKAKNWGTVPIVPGYEPMIIAEDKRTVKMINGAGQIVRYLKDNSERMPKFVEWPVKDRTSWEEYRKRLDPDISERWPDNWDSYVQRINARSKPISLSVGSFYGYLREMVGTERILYMFYDDPGLIEDMMEQICYMEYAIIKRVVKDIRVDLATFWEDMAYKAGPLISPAMVRRFMIPRYKRITELLRSNGVEVIFVDSDGNVSELIPLWLESGINYVWPLEVAAGNDIIALRREYGKDLILGGGIDKRALIKGKEAIREEVMSKVPELLEQGGYLPCVDHAVPPDVTFDNYCYYINLIREVGGLEKLSF